MELQLLALALTAVAVAVAFVYRYITSKFDFFEKQGIEGPKPSFPFGTWKGAWNKNLGEDDLENVGKYGQVFGTFNGRTPNLIVSDPSLIKKILVDEADKFSSHRAFRVKQTVLHNSLQAIEGNESKEVKKILSDAFSGGKIKQLLTRISKTTESFVEELSKAGSADPDKAINISERIANFITDTLAFCLIGFDLSADESIRVKFQRSMNRVFIVDNPESIFSVTPFIYECLGTLDNFILKPKFARYLAGVTNLVISERRKNVDVKPEAKAVDLADLLLAAADEERKVSEKADPDKPYEDVKSKLTNQQLISVFMEVILTVGRATNSSLALSLHALANNQHIQEKLSSEVDKQIARFGEITFDFIHESEYLDMFLGEILRIYPSEYRLERKSIAEVKLGDATIPPGTLVSVPIYAIHHSPEFYPEPNVLNPERFSPANTDKRNHYTYLPFGQAGADSSSIGVQMGVLIAKFAIVSLISVLKFKPSDKIEEPQFVKGITGVPRPESVWVKVEKRE